MNINTLNSFPIANMILGPEPTQAGMEFKTNPQPEDTHLIMLYFKWLTKKNAKNVGINRLVLSSNMSEDIKKFLAREGLSNITDWEFSGMVDYGVVGKAECSHGGHKLRYAYYAYSPSANRELVFGQNCASDFFDVDVATLGSFVKIIAKASRELCYILNKGRNCREFTFTDEAVNCFRMLNNSENTTNPAYKAIYDEIAIRCYSYIGRTAMELWANFISRGLLLPDTLKNIVTDGYRQAAIDVLKSKPEYAEHIGYYLKLKDNENHLLDGNLVPGEIISPLAEMSLTNALRVCILEEIISPTSIALRYDLLMLYKQLEPIEKLSGLYKKRYTRAEIFARQLDKGAKHDITDPLSCMLISLLRNDLRIATFFFGLTQGSLKRISVLDTRSWVQDRIRVGTLNMFEEVWCDQNEWYGNLKNYIDARHPKRSLLVYLYGVLFPDISKALTSNPKPQFHCCYIDDNYPAFTDPAPKTFNQLYGVMDTSKDKDNLVNEGIDTLTQGGSNLAPSLVIGLSLDKNLDNIQNRRLRDIMNILPADYEPAKDASFFETKEDLQIKAMAENLQITTKEANFGISRRGRRTLSNEDDIGLADIERDENIDFEDGYEETEIPEEELEIVDEGYDDISDMGTTNLDAQAYDVSEELETQDDFDEISDEETEIPEEEPELIEEEEIVPDDEFADDFDDFDDIPDDEFEDETTGIDGDIDLSTMLFGDNNNGGEDNE